MKLQLQIPKPIKNALFQSNSKPFKDKNSTPACNALNLLLKLDKAYDLLCTSHFQIEIQNSKFKNPSSLPFPF